MWHNAVGLPDDRGARRTRNCRGPAGNFPFFQVGQSATVGYVNKETLHTSCCLLAKKHKEETRARIQEAGNGEYRASLSRKKYRYFTCCRHLAVFFERHAQSMWLCMTSPSRVHRSRRENSR